MNIIDDILYEPVIKQQDNRDKWVILVSNSYLLRYYNKKYLPRFLTFKEASDICNELCDAIPKLYDDTGIMKIRNKQIFFIKNIKSDCIIEGDLTYDEAFDKFDTLYFSNEYGIGFFVL